MRSARSRSPNAATADDGSAPKSYVLEMLPYPSGTLHVGHMLVYTIGDVVTRFRARNGMRVLHPQGFDSFGLPAENAAIREGSHPRETVGAQHRAHHALDAPGRVGVRLDPSALDARARVLSLAAVAVPEVLRSRARLSERSTGQVVPRRPDGDRERASTGRRNVRALWRARRVARSWSSGSSASPTTRRRSSTTSTRSTGPSRSRPASATGSAVRTARRSSSASRSSTRTCPVFTTRPDTLYGATFFVLAPEHELVAANRLATSPRLRRRTAAKKTKERAAATEKTGVFTGLHAVNPVNGERLPVYVADYVLTDYGTGAVMAVPAHDQRDFDFATAFDLPVRQVVRPPDGEVDESVAYVEHSEGEVLVNSAEFDGMPAPEGGRRIVERLEAEARGRFAINFGCATGASRGSATGAARSRSSTATRAGSSRSPRSELPSCCRTIEDYKPKGLPPLAQAEDWVNVACPKCCGPAKRETETMDTFVDSSWYFLRYCDARNDAAPFERAPVDYWNPVDLYIGGVDHATMHMIYARFWVKVLNDLGLLGFREPFAQFFSNGWVTMGKVKMSKRAGNIVGPDDFIERYGADACRLNILFLGPANEDMEWTESSVEAMARFVRRLWSVVSEVVDGAPAGEPEGGPLARKAHATIAKVTDDIGRRFAFNTAIAAVMELVNELSTDRSGRDARFAAETRCP